MFTHPFLCVAAGALVACWFYLVGTVPLLGGIASVFLPTYTNPIAATVFPAQGLILIYMWTRDAARQRSS